MGAINEATSRNNESVGTHTIWRFWLTEDNETLVKITTTLKQGFSNALRDVKIKYPNAECYRYAGRISYL